MKAMTPSSIQNTTRVPRTSSSATTSPSSISFPQHPPISSSNHVLENVAQLLAWREISPSGKRPMKKLWGDPSRSCVKSFGHRCQVTDAKGGLISWVEKESLRHFSAKYCPLVPPPRSTIAAAFSPDGQTLASTHGDHTVKIICCKTGTCLKILSGHRRTPWVVRFHPTCSEILASGSLDHEVRLWDANTAECIGSRDFYRPIASIAFHAQGDLLAVASGHKLYIWQYNKKGDASSPSIVLRTRRSLRAVHFHPHAAPLLLTAEVNDLDSPDSPMTLATSPGYLQYPPPAVLFTQVRSSTGAGISIPGVNSTSLMPFPCLLWPALTSESDIPSSQGDGMDVQTVNDRHVDGRSTQSEFVNDSEMPSHGMALSTSMDISVEETQTHGGLSSEGSTIGRNEISLTPSQPNVSETNEHDLHFNPSRYVSQDTSMIDRASSFPLREYEEVVPSDDSIASRRNEPGTTSYHQGGNPIMSSILYGRQSNGPVPGMISSNIPTNVNMQLLSGSGTSSETHQLFPVGDTAGWELPFLQGWLMGQTHAGLTPNLPIVEGTNGGIFGIPAMATDRRMSEFRNQQQNNPPTFLSSVAPSSGGTRATGRLGGRPRIRSRLNVHFGSNTYGMPSEGVNEDARVNSTTDDRDTQMHSGAAEAEVAVAHASIAAAAAAAATAELPCTVKLRIWPHNIKDPCALLDPEKCRLTIPHAVLCSEMGAHFSPCGRFLAACVACVLPQQEMEGGLNSQMNHVTGGGTVTSPTRHSIPAQQVVYELRIYSLEEETFGEILASRAIRAAHCLTSIQFSPTSAHILLAYGRRHSSLLRSIVVDGKTTMPIYTILEIYKVSTMELVRVLPSAEDEVNVACFHPLVGGGLVYGTKEGKLRILQHNRAQDSNYVGNHSHFEQNMLEVQTVALEC